MPSPAVGDAMVFFFLFVFLTLAHFINEETETGRDGVTLRAGPVLELKRVCLESPSSYHRTMHFIQSKPSPVRHAHSEGLPSSMKSISTNIA